MFSQDFETFLISLISNKTLQTLYFHIFTMKYLKVEVSYFENVTNVDNLNLSLNAGLDYRSKQEEE